MECLYHNPAYKAQGPLWKSQRLDWTEVRQCLQDIQKSCHRELPTAVLACPTPTQDRANQHFVTEGEWCLKHLPLIIVTMCWYVCLHVPWRQEAQIPWSWVIDSFVFLRRMMGTNHGCPEREVNTLDYWVISLDTRIQLPLTDVAPGRSTKPQQMAQPS